MGILGSLSLFETLREAWPNLWPDAWDSGTSVLIDQGLSSYDWWLIFIMALIATVLLSHRLVLRRHLEARNSLVAQETLSVRDRGSAGSVAQDTTRLDDAIAVLDPEGRILKANSVFLEQTALQLDGVVGRHVSEVDPRGFGHAFWNAALEEARDKGRWTADRRTIETSGAIPSLQMTLQVVGPALEAPSGSTVLRLGTRTDSSYSYPGAQGQDDKLTGLLNRRAMKIQTEAAIVSAQASGREVALVVVDLDRFTDINSAFGDGVGDRVLSSCANIMSRVAQADVQIARTGGDEFAILLSDTGRDAANAFALRLLENLGQELDIGGLRVTLSASAGVAVFPEDAQSQRRLMQSAGRALASAKEMGRGQVKCFSERIQRRTEDNLKLELELRRGLKRGELMMYFQPQVHMRTGTCIGAEALLRWAHPQHGMMLPGAFVPMALDVGLAAAIDRFALGLVCRQIHAWRSQGLELLPVSVNISLTTLMSPDFLELVERSVVQWDIPPGVLQIELVESVHFPKLSDSLLDLSVLRQLGVSLAIDDFGTGYSSVSMLKDLPVSRIKIDRRFIRQISEDRRDDRIVAALIGMGKGLDLSVIAEGVETVEQKDHLIALGCAHAQGFLFSKPLPQDAFAKAYLPAQARGSKAQDRAEAP